MVMIAGVQNRTSQYVDTKNLTDRFRAGDMIREIAIIVGGKGGGRPDFAQAGGSDPSKIDAAFERLDALIAGS